MGCYKSSKQGTKIKGMQAQYIKLRSLKDQTQVVLNHPCYGKGQCLGSDDILLKNVILPHSSFLLKKILAKIKL